MITEIIYNEEEFSSATFLDISDKVLDESLVIEGKNEFSFTLPVSKKEVTFKFLTHGDEQAIAKELKAIKNILDPEMRLGRGNIF